jgi:hypothetical protein
MIDDFRLTISDLPSAATIRRQQQSKINNLKSTIQND